MSPINTKLGDQPLAVLLRARVCCKMDGAVQEVLRKSKKVQTLLVSFQSEALRDSRLAL